MPLFHINLILGFQFLLLTLCDKQEWIWKIPGKTWKGGIEQIAL